MDKTENALALLYDDTILKHNREPCYFEKRVSAQHILDAYNPLCGDKFQLFFNIEDGKVQKATFHGYGCAISKAATSVLVQKIQNMSVHDVQAVIKSYFDGLNGAYSVLAKDGYVHFSEEMKAFLAVRQFPERLTCATLSWEAVQIFFQTQSENGNN